MIGEDPLDLGGQIAFVTGAGQGAGRAIALALAHHNAGGVAVNDFVAERAEAVAAEIRALGVPAVAAPADVGDHASVQSAMTAAAAALGPVTILVNKVTIGATRHGGRGCGFSRSNGLGRLFSRRFRRRCGGCFCGYRCLRPRNTGKR